MNSLLDSNNVKYIIGVLIIIVILYMTMQPVPPNIMLIPPYSMSQNPIPLTLD